MDIDIVQPQTEISITTPNNAIPNAATVDESTESSAKTSGNVIPDAATSMHMRKYLYKKEQQEKRLTAIQQQFQSKNEVNSKKKITKPIDPRPLNRNFRPSNSIISRSKAPKSRPTSTITSAQAAALKNSGAEPSVQLNQNTRATSSAQTDSENLDVESSVQLNRSTRPTVARPDGFENSGAEPSVQANGTICTRSTQTDVFDRLGPSTSQASENLRVSASRDIRNDNQAFQRLHPGEAQFLQTNRKRPQPLEQSFRIERPHASKRRQLQQQQAQGYLPTPLQLPWQQQQMYASMLAWQQQAQFFAPPLPPQYTPQWQQVQVPRKSNGKKGTGKWDPEKLKGRKIHELPHGLYRFFRNSNIQQKHHTEDQMADIERMRRIWIKEQSDVRLEAFKKKENEKKENEKKD